jgi:hypothetical protein
MENGYMSKLEVGDIIFRENQFFKCVFRDKEGCMWSELIGDNNLGLFHSGVSLIGKEAWLSEDNKKCVDLEKYYSGENIEDGFVEYKLAPIKKTRLALKMIPKKDILKETEEWLWVK